MTSTPASVPISDGAEPAPVVAEDCADECRHEMVPRCPWCRTEMYAPAVWAFSHGEVRCACGFTLDPKVKR